MLDFLDPGFVGNPYPTYGRLRADGGVCRIGAGVWFVSRYEDAANALLHKDLSNRPSPFALVNARHRDDFVAADVAQHLIAFRDPPDATAPRRFIATELQAFCRGRTAMLDDLAARMVARIVPGDRFDLVDSIAIPYAVRAMCRIFGLPDTDADRLKGWSALFFHMFHAIPDRATLMRMNTGAGEFRAYVQAAVARARAAPGDDLISIMARPDAGVLDDAALVANLMLLIADSIENVWAGIASAVLTLIDNHQRAAQHLAQGGTWTGLVDECLRLESPGQYQGRIATDPVELGGTTVKRNELVLVGLAAANRDPEVFEDPGAFRPGRKGPRHLAFGLGRHACVGGSLVRMETAAILSALWPVLPHMQVTERPVRWNARAGHRWLAALPLRLDAGWT